MKVPRGRPHYSFIARRVFCGRPFDGRFFHDYEYEWNFPWIVLQFFKNLKGSYIFMAVPI